MGRKLSWDETNELLPAILFKSQAFKGVDNSDKKPLLRTVELISSCKQQPLHHKVYIA